MSPGGHSSPDVIRLQMAGSDAGTGISARADGYRKGARVVRAARRRISRALWAGCVSSLPDDYFLSVGGGGRTTVPSERPDSGLTSSWVARGPVGTCHSSSGPGLPDPTFKSSIGTRNPPLPSAGPLENRPKFFSAPRLLSLIRASIVRRQRYLHKCASNCWTPAPARRFARPDTAALASLRQCHRRSVLVGRLYSSGTSDRIGQLRAAAGLGLRAERSPAARPGGRLVDMVSCQCPTRPPGRAAVSRLRREPRMTDRPRSGVSSRAAPK